MTKEKLLLLLLLLLESFGLLLLIVIIDTLNIILILKNDKTNINIISIKNSIDLNKKKERTKGKNINFKKIISTNWNLRTEVNKNKTLTKEKMIKKN